MRAAFAAVGPASWSTLIRHLRVARGHESRALRRVLDALVASGEVVRSRQGIFRFAASGDTVAGTTVRVAGKLLLETADGRRLDISDDALIRPGDRVEAVATSTHAEAVRVVTPSSAPVVGVLGKAGRSWFADSLDPDLKGRIDLAATPPARPGTVVELKIHSVSARSIEGSVSNVIEAGNEAARAAKALLAAHRIPQTWPLEPSSLHIPSTVAAHEAASRKDYRQLPLVTVDGADARDFDDAVFAAPRLRGGWQLVVAIADVAHYVESGSALDDAARERGNSVYLPDRVVPMLPEALSNGICSLVAHEDRLAVVCEMTISAQGRISGHAFCEAVIRSRARLTYDAVDGFLRGNGLDVDDDVKASLSTLHDVYRALRERRDARGALDFDAHEANVVLHEGSPQRVQPVQRNDAHRLIEEAMIAANVAAARHLEKQRTQLPGPPPVYRVHEPPAKDKMEALDLALRIVGEKLPSGALTPQALAEACNRARAKSSWPAWIWDAIVLRTLAQARYEPRRLGHFGLALPTYLHFTSPIRRYADLLAHRLIKGETPSADALDAAASHISMTERRADDVGRAVDAWLKCALVENRVGETFEGTVAAVTAFGMFVELDGLFIQGLVHISKLGRDYYHYLPETMSLAAERSGARYCLGDRVEVVIEEVSVASGRIGLVLAGQPRRRSRRRRRR